MNKQNIVGKITKYKVDDNVYIVYPIRGILIVDKWKIHVVNIQEYIEQKHHTIDIRYGFYNKGDTRLETEICGTTEKSVIRHINEYYNNEIDNINKYREESLQKFKER